MNMRKLSISILVAALALTSASAAFAQQDRNQNNPGNAPVVSDLGPEDGTILGLPPGFAIVGGVLIFVGVLTAVVVSDTGSNPPPVSQ